MYNSTQAQPQVPVTTTSPWSKAKKKPRPNGGSDATLDEEAGFIQTETSLDGHDLYLDDHGVNLSPAVTQQQHGTNHHNHHHHHQPITATPMRRDRSLSPANVPISSAIPSSVLRSEQMPRSAPASPQKNRHTNSAIYQQQQQQQQQFTNGYSNHHHHHHPHHQHPEIRRYLLIVTGIIFNKPLEHFLVFLMIQGTKWRLHSQHSYDAIILSY
jgi:hypothetical protein